MSDPSRRSIVNGRTILVTGGTGGIGYQTARVLGRWGAKVVITGRDADAGERAAAAIRRESGRPSVSFLQADHATVAGNRLLAEQVRRGFPDLAVLVNNVGGLYGTRWETADGCEATLAMNFLGPFTLTYELLPLLQANAPARCINVVSAAFKLWRPDPFQDLQSTRHFVSGDAYPRAKLLNVLDRERMAPDTVKGSQVRQPLFEFSGACAGCGETQYLRLISQLFGDRLLVANATGCSSIYGGNLPTTPWTQNAEGRGPAWANSLFEDNAEFGLGIRLAADRQAARARQLTERLAPQVGGDLAAAILGADQHDEAAVAAQRERVAELRGAWPGSGGPGGLEERSGSPPEEILGDARELEGLADELVRRSVWIVGGDGWAYDIGSAGVDAVLASGQDVNLLVLDTEVYSNTGGQASKASPRGAVAKFAARGKQTTKKDLGMLAMAYGNVYVAHVAVGSSDMQTVKALLEAEAYPGPSLVIAYSACIAHGFDMTGSMAHMRDAVRSGHWPLYRYHPDAERPFHLDSKPPTMPLREFAVGEARFAMLARTAPEEFERLMALAEEDARERWRYYEQLAGVTRTAPHLPPRPVAPTGAGSPEEEAP